MPSLKFVLLVIVAVVFEIQPKEVSTNEECPEATSCLKPLNRIYATRYDLVSSLDLDDSVVSSTVRIRVRAYDSRSQLQWPKDMIALNVDKDIQVELVDVLKEETSWPHDQRYLEVDICHDTDNQLLVIKVNEDIDTRSNILVLIKSRSPIKFDEINDARQEVGAIRINFASSQAHFSVPCIDNFEHKTNIWFRLAFSPDLTASSDMLTKVMQGTLVGKKYAVFESAEPISLAKVTFKLGSDDDLGERTTKID